MRRVHAVALELATGEAANGRHALHSCDTPLCCNTEHLRWGSNADNVADKVERGRQGNLAGEQHPSAVLTEEQVAEIRRRYRPRSRDNSLVALGREFGVHLSTIHTVVTGKHWNR